MQKGSCAHESSPKFCFIPAVTKARDRGTRAAGALRRRRSPRSTGTFRKFGGNFRSWRRSRPLLRPPRTDTPVGVEVPRPTIWGHARTRRLLVSNDLFYGELLLDFDQSTLISMVHADSTVLNEMICHVVILIEPRYSLMPHSVYSDKGIDSFIGLRNCYCALFRGN